MRKFVLLTVIILGLAGVSFAGSLVDLGNGMYYDPSVDITYLNQMVQPVTVGAAENWATHLNVNGVTGWILPTAYDLGTTNICTGLDCTNSALGHLFYTDLGNAANQPYPTVNLGVFTSFNWSTTGVLDPLFWTSTQAPDYVQLDGTHDQQYYAFNFGFGPDSVTGSMDAIVSRVGGYPGVDHAYEATAIHLGCTVNDPNICAGGSGNPGGNPGGNPTVPEPGTLLLLGSGLLGVASKRLLR